MRHLLLLRGAPGSGKSTFVKENQLEAFTLSADALRLLMQSPVTNPDGTASISQKNDRAVWELLHQVMAARAARGEFIVVDATHSRPAWLNNYRKIVEAARYRVNVLEFTPTLETLYAQNATRPALQRVPEEYIATSHTRIATQALPGWVKKISLDEYASLTSNPMSPLDLSAYRQIHHFGDLHGCATVLRDYFARYPYTPEDYYIFVGDYVDRGVENGALMNFLHEELLGRKNVLFLEGNHDGALRAWGNEETDQKKGFLYHTVPDLVRAGFTQEKARAFTRRLGQMAWYRFGAQTVYVNHAGHPHLPSVFTPTQEMIYGVGKYEDMEVVAETFARLHPHVTQVFGHRNNNLVPIRVNAQVFNLCDRIEYGGNLRVAVLGQEGWETRMIPNPVFASDPHAVLEVPPQPSTSPLAALMENKLVKKTRLPNNLVSFNFTREVFYKGKWDALTTRARGLFVEMNTGQVVARSYDKFFNLGERRETELKNLQKTLQFPVECWIKENGFLGLIGYDPIREELVITTKSTTEGEFVGYFKEIIAKTGFDLEAARTFCKNEKCTLVFEVIDPVHDPHIIEYDEPALYLLEIIQNAYEYENYPYEILQSAAQTLGCEVKARYQIFETWEVFAAWYATVENNYWYTPYPQDYPPTYVEGFVIEDRVGAMVKIKTKYYSTWKKLRGVLEALSRRGTYNTAWLVTPLENRVYAWLKQQDWQRLAGMGLIEMRRAYLKETGDTEA